MCVIALLHRTFQLPDSTCLAAPCLLFFQRVVCSQDEGLLAIRGIFSIPNPSLPCSCLHKAFWGPGGGW